MIDLHTHILPGIDDGPATIDGALDLARDAVAAGTTTIVATPHVNSRFPNDSYTIGRAVAGLRASLIEAGIALDLRAGAEVAILQAGELADAELDRLRLGSGPWLLIESPYTMLADTIPFLIGQIQAREHRILLAHPERCQGFRRKPDLLEAMVNRQGVITSVTAGALIGRFGRDVQRFALALAEQGLVHNVASDAHDCDRRPPGIAEAMQRSGLGAHVELLTEAVPEAILAGDRLPAIPGTLLAKRRQRLAWRRSRDRPD